MNPYDTFCFFDLYNAYSFIPPLLRSWSCFFVLFPPATLPKLMFIAQY